GGGGGGGGGPAGPALPPLLEPSAGNRSSLTKPSCRAQPQVCTTVSWTGLAALIEKVVVSWVVGELPLQSAGANGMLVPSACLQSIAKSNTPRPRAFSRSRQAGCGPCGGGRLGASPAHRA